MKPPSESKIMLESIYELNNTRLVRVMRNTVGVDTVNGITYGLGLGSSDVVGVLRETGRVFVQEFKRPGAHTDPDRLRKQQAWQRVIRKFGGFACFSTSVEESMAALDRAMKGASE